MRAEAASGGRRRIGVDVGGTFTDLAVADEGGMVRVYKVPSTPADPAQGVLAALERAATAAGEEVGQFLSTLSHFVHGSTIATNTAIEGKGALTGLLVTEGFRDFLEIRRGARENSWDHRTPYAPVLVPRRLRLPVGGRIDAKGREIQQLDRQAAEAAIAVFQEEGVEAVALCFINSFLNGSHEDVVAELVQQALPAAYVSKSHVVAPIMGEYERGSTVVLNAYVAARTVNYLRSLAAELAHRGLEAPLLLIQNNGGSTSVEEVADRPVNLLLSGPAAGVGALAHFAVTTGNANLISMEIGGTSCDVMLMAEGKVPFVEHLEIAGYGYVSPSVEVHTVGAGGGAIARLDDAGLLEVGPEGAGARPGPACYGFGGTAPTVTDAQVVLGRLEPGPYADGAVHLDGDLAYAAIERQIARPLGLGVEAAASGIVRLMEQKLLLAVQRLSTERGHDPKRFTLVAGGGAGPLHVAAVGRALGCRTVHVPRLSGAFCALGMLGAEVRHDHFRFHFDDLDAGDRGALEEVFTALEREARDRLGRERFGPAEVVLQRALDLRYVGQQWDITVPVEAPFSPDRVRVAFDLIHQRLYGHTQPGGQIGIMKARVTGSAAFPPLARPHLPQATTAPVPAGRRQVWIGPETGWCETPIFAGRGLLPGHRLEGPAIVDEQTTTVLIGVGDKLVVDHAGDYAITIGAGER